LYGKAAAAATTTEQRGKESLDFCCSCCCCCHFGKKDHHRFVDFFVFFFSLSPSSVLEWVSFRWCWKARGRKKRRIICLQVPSSSSSSSSLWVIWVLWVWLFSLSPTELCIQLYGGWKWWILFFSRAICGWCYYNLGSSLPSKSLPPSLPWAFYSLGTSSCSCCQLCSSGLFVFSSSKCRSFAKGLLALESREYQPDVQQLRLLSVFCCPFLHARFAHVQGCGMKVPYIESFTFSQ